MAKMKSLQLVVFLACATCLLALPTVAQTGSDSVDAAFSRATQLHQAGDIEGAIRGYESILTTHPERVDVRSNLGAAYSRLGRYEDAIAQYTQALKLDNRNESIRFNLALAYYKGAMFVEAADEFTKFLASAAADVHNVQTLSCFSLTARCVLETTRKLSSRSHRSLKLNRIIERSLFY
jgi:Flp pilus assembly protein TadD